MARFTKELRQQIVEDFARRNNGVYNPTLFLQEVRAKGPDHPAYDWFEWDVEKAALAYQVEQARDFARDLRIRFEVEEVGRKEAITVRPVAMPLVISPVANRRDGGGYFLSNPDDPEHVAEHCRQAATALRAWADRYQSALAQAGVQSKAIESITKALDTAASRKAIEAA